MSTRKSPNRNYAGNNNNNVSRGSRNSGNNNKSRSTSTRQWHTRLFDCCVQPGGWTLCLQSFFCSCHVSGRMWEWLDMRGGYFAGLLIWFVPFILGGTGLGVGYATGHGWFGSLNRPTDERSLTVVDWLWSLSSILMFVFSFLLVLWYAVKTLEKLYPRQQGESTFVMMCKGFWCQCCFMMQVRREQIIKTRILPVQNQDGKVAYYTAVDVTTTAASSSSAAMARKSSPNNSSQSKIVEDAVVIDIDYVEAGLVRHNNSSNNSNDNKLGQQEAGLVNRRNNSSSNKPWQQQAEESQSGQRGKRSSSLSSIGTRVVSSRNNRQQQQQQRQETTTTTTTTAAPHPHAGNVFFKESARNNSFGEIHYDYRSTSNDSSNDGGIYSVNHKQNNKTPWQAQAEQANRSRQRSSSVSSIGGWRPPKVPSKSKSPPKSRKSQK